MGGVERMKRRGLIARVQKATGVVTVPDRKIRAEHWADRICTQLGKTVESIIEVGRLLLKAKADLTHGEWGRLFEDDLVPFGQNAAGQLMKVASHPLLSNSDHGKNLPPSWRTLYQLSRVEPKRLSAAFRDGVIKPDMKRSEVSVLLPAKIPRASRPARSKADEAFFSPEIECFFDVEARIKKTFFNLDEDQQRDLVTRVQQLVGQLEQSIQRKTA